MTLVAMVVLLAAVAFAGAYLGARAAVREMGGRLEERVASVDARTARLEAGVARLRGAAAVVVVERGEGNDG